MVIPYCFFFKSIAFAVNLNIFLSNPGIELDPSGSIGRLETNLLSKILKTRKELEGKANDCREVCMVHVCVC